MWRSKEICNLQKKWTKNKVIVSTIMLEIMKSKMVIDLKIFISFMKNQVISNLNRIVVVTIHMSGIRKKNFYICK